MICLKYTVKNSKYFEISLIILICSALYFLNYSSTDSEVILPTIGLFVAAMFRIIPIIKV